ncbi:MAG: DUF1488 domain-containing protein [Rhodospirillales bacterium CG15_BIG_FIL_POST_REV_8_21_14_020_66_15]|nr:MAG: DUF1488 domain-containing protein [Rhodospirillales bacterium CG15_BIG_FIL_POST_REV_8_21_14_020_66_15]
MGLNFPNHCRSFEARWNRVRFWGYDSALEITFFLEGSALRKLSPEAGPDETGVLRAFDAAVARIHDVARKVYENSRERSDVHVLAEGHF